MTEKEFLTEFAKRYETLNLKYDVNDNVRETFIDQFLKQIHYEYYEVEFVKRDHYNDSEPLTFQGVPIVFDKE